MNRYWQKNISFLQMSTDCWSRCWRFPNAILPKYTFFSPYLLYLIWAFCASSDIRPPEIGRTHHHGRHRRHQIGTLPIVPLNAVVAHRAGWAGIENAIQIGRPTCLKPPACRRNTFENWWEVTWVQFKFVKLGIQMNSCQSAETLNWRRGKTIVFMRGKECLTRSGFRHGWYRANVPPEASWAHLQVQWSLSLSLVLNWVPEWAKLLIRPAVPL